jgi:hypothetical protein
MCLEIWLKASSRTGRIDQTRKLLLDPKNVTYRILKGQKHGYMYRH